ncbi:MAG TPA: 23S rRNA methyltransferase, partial [Rhodospirillaceae bacterium]|nr:23S rRNA methyltransferase [Rhodospirillaceae bacterium]
MSRNKAKTRVRSARGRKNSSTRWLQRQLNDPYVNRAQKEGYRGRAAFKLVEMNEKLNFLRPDMT